MFQNYTSETIETISTLQFFIHLPDGKFILIAFITCASDFYHFFFFFVVREDVMKKSVFFCTEGVLIKR